MLLKQGRITVILNEHGLGLRSRHCGSARPGSLQDPPEDPLTKELYVAVGSAVEVPCKGEGGEEGQWGLNGMELHAVLSIRNTTLEDQGNYTCHSRDGSLLQTLSLRPGYPPSRPTVKCWSPSYPRHALCSWSEGPEPLLPTRYTATYGMGLWAGHLLQPCLPVPGLRHHCQLNIRIYHQDAHSINVTATNPLGSASTFFSFMVEDVVKPDPPVDVKVVRDSKAKTLSVTWAPPPSWTAPAIFPLKYMVRYHTGNSNAARKLGPFLSPAMALKGLRGGETYTVQVSAQDRLVGQSSDWSAPVSATVLPHEHAGQR